MRNGEELTESPRIVGKMGVERELLCLCSTEVSVQNKTRYNPAEGSTEDMSPLDHGIILNRKIRSRVMIMCQLIKTSST